MPVSLLNTARAAALALLRPLVRPLLTTLGGLLGYGVVNSQRFVIERHTRPLAALREKVRVVQLADLHYGNWVGLSSVERWVAATNAQHPDLIVITGDFLDSGIRSRYIPHLLAELAKLRAPLGVYCVYGNHDWTSLNTHAVRARFAQELERSGITLLGNAGIQLRPDLYLCGVDDWWFGQQDMAAALRGYMGGACLLLSHNPDFLPYVPPAVTLTLCGHTHGGQVRVPFLGPLRLASLYGTRFLQGWVSTAPEPPEGGSSAVDQVVDQAVGTDAAPVTERQITGYVSRGLGVTGVPLRLNCPAELTVFDFLPA